MYRFFAVMFVLLITSQQVFALDGTRKGFSISVGGGIHSIDVEGDESFFSAPESVSESGIATSLKIGGGVNQNLSLYYIRNASWFDSEYVYVAGMSGIAATYHVRQTAPSLYFLASVGFADYAAPFTENVDVTTGTGYMFGVGYEFKAHWMVEGTYFISEYDDSDISSPQLTLNYMWY